MEEISKLVFLWCIELFREIIIWELEGLALGFNLWSLKLTLKTRLLTTCLKEHLVRCQIIVRESKLERSWEYSTYSLKHICLYFHGKHIKKEGRIKTCFQLYCIARPLLCALNCNARSLPKFCYFETQVKSRQHVAFQSMAHQRYICFHMCSSTPSKRFVMMGESTHSQQKQVPATICWDTFSLHM